MHYRGILVVFCVGLLLASCRETTQVGQGPRFGRGVSVECRMRLMPVSEQLDGPDHVLACLVWVTRENEDLSGMRDATHGPQHLRARCSKPPTCRQF